MDSVAIATEERGGNFQVQIECNLEAFFKHCEDGSLSFALVECGCPYRAGTLGTRPCRRESMKAVSNAECAPSDGRTPLIESRPRAELSPIDSWLSLLQWLGDYFLLSVLRLAAHSH